MSQENKNNVIKIISGSKGQFPIKLGIVPNRLAVSIYLHHSTVSGKNVACWSYVSDGLISLKQKEIVFTLQAQDGEDTSKFPTQPLQVFLLIYKYAAQQKILNIGDVIKLGEKGMFGFPALAFTYPLMEIPGAPLTRPTLSALLLSKEEHFIAHTFGLSRVVSRLGFEQKRYPCLAANQRGRKSINWRPVLDNSTIKNTPRSPVKQSSVYMAGGDQVVVQFHPAVKNTLVNIVKKHDQNQPLCLTMQLLPLHEGCLVWLPEQDATEMHMKPAAFGESIAGSFIVLQPNQMNDGAMILEDGFAMQFTPDSWHGFLQALVSGQQLHIPGAEGGMDFLLVWGDKPIVTEDIDTSEEHGGGGGFFQKIMGKLKK